MDTKAQGFLFLLLLLAVAELWNISRELKAVKNLLGEINGRQAKKEWKAPDQTEA